MLDWDDLRFFLAVARGGSLSAAARALGVAQPTVGRRIAAFEAQLGARLFVTTPGGTAMTRPAERLLQHAARMEGDALAVERTARGRDVGLAGRVTVTASEWLIDRVIGPLLGAFAERHPGLEIDLVGEARPLNLVRREADIAVRPARFEHQELVELAVGTVRFALYASAQYLARRGRPDFARQGEGHVLIAMSEWMTRVPDVELFARVAGLAHVTARANGRLAMASLALAGAGLAVLPRLVGDGTLGLVRVATPLPDPERGLWMASHRDARGVVRMKRVLAFLRDGLRRTFAGGDEPMIG
jgi:DNA-binding transcriptional LysR family regulator